MARWSVASCGWTGKRFRQNGNLRLEKSHVNVKIGPISLRSMRVSEDLRPRQLKEVKVLWEIRVPLLFFNICLPSILSIKNNLTNNRLCLFHPVLFLSYQLSPCLYHHLVLSNSFSLAYMYIDGIFEEFKNFYYIKMQRKFTDYRELYYILTYHIWPLSLPKLSLRLKVRGENTVNLMIFIELHSYINK